MGQTTQVFTVNVCCGRSGDTVDHNRGGNAPGPWILRSPKNRAYIRRQNDVVAIKIRIICIAASKTVVTVVTRITQLFELNFKTVFLFRNQNRSFLFMEVYVNIRTCYNIIFVLVKFNPNNSNNSYRL